MDTANIAIEEERDVASDSGDPLPAAAPSSPPTHYLCIAFPALPEEGADAIPWLRRIVWPCVKGLIIARVLPSEEVTLDSHPQTAIPLEAVKLGNNVEWNEEHTEVVAVKSGRIHLRHELLAVEEVWELNEDLDASSGPIDFPGEVTLRKNVLDLVKLSATGDIVVHGSVEAAVIHSKSNVTIHHGVCGKEHGLVSAVGNVSVRFASNARIRAGGNIIVGNEIASSDLVCGGKVLAEHASILSGRVEATAGIICDTAGSEAAVRVLLELGLSSKEITQIGTVLAELKSCRAHAEQIRAAIEPLMKDPKRLTNQQKEKATQLLCKAAEFEEKVQALTTSLDASRKRLDLVLNGVVEIKGRVYPEVTVAIAGVLTVFKKEHAGLMKIARRDDGGTPQLVAIDGHNRASLLPTAITPNHSILHALRTGAEG